MGLAFILSLVSPLRADEITSVFDQANKLYEQGKYSEAVSAYEQVLNSGHSSAALHFNLGNAYLKAEQVGRAIFHYRLAAQLSPRDPDIRANLRFARSRVSGSAATASGWWDWTRTLSLNELTWLALAAWWLWWSVLAAGQIASQKSRVLRKLAQLTGALTIAFAAWLAWVWSVQIGSRPAVVIAKEAVVRLGPFEESQSAFVLHDGAELSIQDRKLDWVQIQDGAGRRGWLRPEQLALLNPETSARR